jgi:hypothetical protein
MPSEPGEADRHLAVFHTSKTCARIKDPMALRRVDKPYSAARCNVCAAIESKRPRV